jgi:hypothetical protein
MQTPFDDPIMKTPSASGDFQGTRGGFDLPDGMKETPGTGGIPNQPTVDSFTGDTPPGPQDISSYMANRTWPASKAQNG